MAVVGTRARDDYRRDYGYGYIYENRIPQYKWDNVNPVRTNSNKMKSIYAARQRYSPRYRVDDILDRIPWWAKAAGLRILKGLL